MTFRVEIAPSAIAEADAAYESIAAGSPAAAARWLDELANAVASLGNMPRRHGFAREHGRVSYELRQFRHAPYRILFTIVEDVVRVLHVRHQAMDDMPPRELGR